MTKRFVFVEDVAVTTPLLVQTPDGPRAGQMYMVPHCNGMLAVGERPDGLWSVVHAPRGHSCFSAESKVNAPLLAGRLFELAAEDGIDLASADEATMCRWVPTASERLVAEFSAAAAKPN